MRVAALYDIHGNLPALEAVLSAVEEVDVDRVVVGGDFIWGPFPAETIRLLRALDDRALVIAGNSEREVVDRLDQTDELPPRLIPPVRWTAERLEAEALAFVAALPKSVELDVDGLGRTIFCHATPRSDEELITRATPVDALDRVLEGVVQDAVVCGHTHMQYDRTAGAKRIINPGSVGMPYEAAPGAYWAVLGTDVDLRRTRYDVVAAAERIRATGFPFPRLVEVVTSPPPQEEVVEQFEAARVEALHTGFGFHAASS